jgi:hypothetical protein
MKLAWMAKFGNRTLDAWDSGSLERGKAMKGGFAHLSGLSTDAVGSARD